MKKLVISCRSSDVFVITSTRKNQGMLMARVRNVAQCWPCASIAEVKCWVLTNAAVPMLPCSDRKAAIIAHRWEARFLRMQHIVYQQRCRMLRVSKGVKLHALKRAQLHEENKADRKWNGIRTRMTISDSTELSWTIDYIPNALLAECRRLYGDQTLHQDRARYRSRTVIGATTRKNNDSHNEVTNDSTYQTQRGREEEVRNLK